MHGIQPEQIKKPTNFEGIMPLLEKEELDAYNKHCAICKRDYNSKACDQHHMDSVHTDGKKSP